MATPHFLIAPLRKTLLTAFLLFACTMAFSQAPGLYINEVSQGASGNKEYVELLVVSPPNCTGITTLDLRGWYIDDNNGAHATGSGTGIAPGCVRFTQNALWSAVPGGTLIVIYNSSDLNASLPANDVSLTDGNCRLVIPDNNCTLLEKNTAQPSTANATYPTTGITACGSWSTLSMSNGDDSFHTVTPAGTVFHAVSWGNNTLNNIIYFSGSSGMQVAYMTNATSNNINLQANWTRVTVTGNETPGVANNAANQAWIATMNNNCTPFVPLSATPSSTNAGCGCTGTASAVATGTAGGFSYAWTPAVAGNVNTANNLCPGTYTLVITDAVGCTETEIFTIAGSPALAVTSVQTPVSCNGGNDGSATVSPSGGTPPFTYAWAPTGGNTATASGLSAGTYICTVTDFTGCTGNVTVTISQPAALTASTVLTPVSCNGGNNGNATVIPAGGNGNYTYSWAPAGGNAASAVGLTAGTYTCTITDALGCNTTATAQITAPAPLTATVASASVDCNGGNNGSATVSPAGGNGNYSYSWTPAGGNSATATGLTAGTYTCTISDALGCTTTATASVTQPAVITSTNSSTPVDCNGGSNGTATISPAGGNGNYSYTWLPAGGNSSTAVGLTAGSYTCTITDAAGCTANATITISQPTPLVVSFTSVQAGCNQSNGVLTATATGGNGGYTYQWNNGPATATWNNLAAGTYTLSVTDQNGCNVISTATVTTVQGVVATITSVTSASCNGSSDGSISAAISGGQGPFTYAWSAPANSQTATASGLTAGSYTLTVTDGNGCTSQATANVLQPLPVSVNATATLQTLCAGNSTQLNATATGGNGNFVFGWMPGPATGSSVSVTPSSNTTYTVTATDVNGCTGINTIDIAVVPLPAAAFTADVLQGCAPLCVNFSDQSSVTAPSSVTGWSWNMGNSATSTGSNANTCYNTPGQYDVSLTVTSSDGCASTISIPAYITVHAQPLAAFTTSPVQPTIADPQVFFVDASLNAASWNWYFGDVNNTSSNLQNPQFTYDAAVCYTVRLEVTSAQGCVDDTLQDVCIEPEISLYIPNTFTPNGDGINDVFIPAGNGLVNSGYELLIYDRWGNLLFESNNLSVGWDGRVEGKTERVMIDTYVWKLQVRTVTGRNISRMGHVNVIR
jgi:gliding motility-associated-like protein